MITYKIRQAKWPSKFYPALHRKALEVYHQMLVAYSNSYDAIKHIFLLHAGITPEGKVQEMMSQTSTIESDCCRYVRSFPRNSVIILAWLNLGFVGH